jgi:hypothetical protein
MKKNKMKDQEQKRRPRRLVLSRETIKTLDDAALLELVRGGVGDLGDSGGSSCTSNSLGSGG